MCRSKEPPTGGQKQPRPYSTRTIADESYQKCALFQIRAKLRCVKTGRLLPWLAGVASFFLYAATAAPSIVELFDDSLEFQLVGPTFGIAHPTGYPLYILLSGVWSRLLFPFGNWAWRMNLFSALAAAAAVGMTTAVAQQLTAEIKGRLAWTPALATALVFGLGPIWWKQATVAEVYALHGLFVAAILAVAVRLAGDFKTRNHRPGLAPSSPQPPFTQPSARHIALLCLLGGLGLAHHRTVLLLAPAVGVYLLWASPNVARPQKSWWLWGGALLGPLLLYLFIPLRASMGVSDLHGSYTNNWQGFWDHVLARQYTTFFGENPLAVERSVLDWLGLWVEQTGIVGLVLGLTGLAQLGRAAQRKAWVLVLLVLVINLVFALTYRVHDAEVFLLPALLAFSLLVGGGVARLLLLCRSWPILEYGCSVLYLLALALGSGRSDPVNRSQDWAAHDYAVAMAKVDFPPGSHVVALEGEATALHYMQAAEGFGRNAIPVVANDPAQRRALVAELSAQDIPLYLTRELEGIGNAYSFTGAGPLVRVWPRGQAQTGEPSYPQEIYFVDRRLRLEGYDLAKLEQAGGPALEVAFYWRPEAVLPRVLKLSLRLQMADGAPIHWPTGEPVQHDAFPLRMVAPMPDWLPGERVRDVYTLPVPKAAAGQPARLVAILYDAETLAEEGVWSVDVGW